MHVIMEESHDMVENLLDWLKILANLMIDIIKCQGFQTNDIEMNQRINHLLFILNLVKEGNNIQLQSVFQDLKTLQVTYLSDQILKVKT